MALQTNKGLSRRIREVAQEKYILPALRAGVQEFSVRVRDLMEDLRKEGFSPDQNTPQFCTSIQVPTFLSKNGLEIIGVEGPPSKLSTTVVVNYRVIHLREHTEEGGSRSSTPEETPEQRAFRLTEKLRGLMKDEIAAHGGTEGFMRWVRSEEELNEKQGAV